MELSPGSYADSTLLTIKSLKASSNDCESGKKVKKMKKGYSKQREAVSSVLRTYNETMTQLKQIETFLARELAMKEIDIEKPDLDVNEVFIIIRNKRSEARRRLQAKLKNQEKTKESSIKALEIANNEENMEVKELELIFGEEGYIEIECESEESNPYVPLAISQVFS